ncbi:hypothetical protein [Rhodohalobacter sp. 8-1]|uniref:hypothetical protein n=1 Tax=Rhodohalobacter sp. 8-1 TaxID=3131972 RepID=UPI0030EF24B1
MKPDYFSYTVIWIFAASLLAGACSNTKEQPPAQAEADELTNLPQLMVQSGDSLLFIQAAPSDPDGKPALPATLENVPIIAYSYIEPARPLNTIKSYEPGTLIHFSLDENLAITARINRNQPIGDTIRTLTGPILDPYTGNVILSIGEEAVTGSIDLLSENRHFYIRYNRYGGYYYLAEIDRSELDILEGSEPLEY